MIHRRHLMWTALLVWAMVWSGARAQEARIVSLEMIWDKSPHNAFTDLVRFKERWFCAFREGEGHVSHDGKIRILVSTDAKTWESAALLEAPGDLPDLRDPKITLAPDGRLMLTTAAADRRMDPSRHQSYAWYSNDGMNWAAAIPIGDPDFWLWRVSWQDRTAWSVGYATKGAEIIRLYKSTDGKLFEGWVPNLLAQESPNETSLHFAEDGTGLCLLRRDGAPGHGLLGTSKPPYKEWTWKDLGIKIGGPCMSRLPDGRFVAAARLYDGKVRTALLWLDVEKGALKEFLALPSGGDTSYPGLVWHQEHLWVSYYASHEGKAKIYLAKIQLPPAGS